MKNFRLLQRMLLLVSCAAFAHQQAHADLPALTTGLTTLKDKLEKLSLALNNVPGKTPKPTPGPKDFESAKKQALSSTKLLDGTIKRAESEYEKFNALPNKNKKVAKMIKTSLDEAKKQYALAQKAAGDMTDTDFVNQFKNITQICNVGIASAKSVIEKTKLANAATPSKEDKEVAKKADDEENKIRKEIINTLRKDYGLQTRAEIDTVLDAVDNIGNGSLDVASIDPKQTERKEYAIALEMALTNLCNEAKAEYTRIPGDETKEPKKDLKKYLQDGIDILSGIQHKLSNLDQMKDKKSFTELRKQFIDAREKFNTVIEAVAAAHE